MMTPLTMTVIKLSEENFLLILMNQLLPSTKIEYL